MANEPTRRVRIEERTEPVEHVDHVDRVDQVDHVERGRAHDVAYATRTILQLVYLIFGVFEVLLLIRFIMKIGNANAANQVIAALYGITEPLVRPFFGIFPQTAGAQFEIPALLALAFLVLVEALVVALIRALAPRY